MKTSLLFAHSCVVTRSLVPSSQPDRCTKLSVLFFLGLYPCRVANYFIVLLQRDHVAFNDPTPSIKVAFESKRVRSIIQEVLFLVWFPDVFHVEIFLAFSTTNVIVV